MVKKLKKIFTACLAATMTFSTVTISFADEVLTKEDTGIVRYAGFESMDSGASQNNGDVSEASQQANYHLTGVVEGDQLILKLNFTGGSEVAGGNYTIDYDTEVFSLVSANRGAALAKYDMDDRTADIVSDASASADINYVNGRLEGFIHGSFTYMDGYQSGSTELAVITLKMKKGSFDKDHISFSRSNLFDLEGKKITDLQSIAPVIKIICGHAKMQYADTRVETAKEDGELTGTCLVCGETVTKVIPKLAADNFVVNVVNGSNEAGECSVGKMVACKAEIYKAVADMEGLQGDIRYVPVSYKVGEAVTALTTTDDLIQFTPDAEGEFAYSVTYERQVFDATGWVSGEQRFTVEKYVTVEAVVYEEGWQQTDKGWWYQYADGTYPKSEWKQIEGKWYYFAADGYMKKGWLSQGGKWYYLNGDGSMAAGKWKQISGKWYYFLEDGVMKTGWLSQGGKWYYLNGDGSMVSGAWKQVDGKWYYFAADGVMKTGWLSQGGKWYYLNGDGSMVSGAWKQIDGKWYYFVTDGVMKTGWLSRGGKWYYLNGDGSMVSGAWKQIDGKWYHFAKDGIMQTGWYKEIKDDLLEGDIYYYLKSDGSMAVDEWVDNEQYYVDADGHWVRDQVKE